MSHSSAAFEPKKVLAEVKRRIASQKHAVLPSRVRVPFGSSACDPEATATKYSCNSRRFMSWMEYASKVRAKWSEQSELQAGVLYCSVPDLVANTDYTASEVWKDARDGRLLDVEVSAVTCEGTVARQWTPVATYLENVRQQCQKLECEVRLPDAPAFRISYQYKERPDLTLLDVCIDIEHRVPECASPDEALSWSFVLQQSGSEDIINTTQALEANNHTGPSRWWSMSRFGATVCDYSALRHLVVHPIAPELRGDASIIESIGMTNSRKAHAAELRRKRDTELRHTQDLEYHASLQADRLRGASGLVHRPSTEECTVTAPPSSNSSGTRAPPSSAVNPSEPPHAPEVATELGDFVGGVTVAAEDAAREGTEETPLTREQLRHARQRYFETRFLASTAE